MNPFTLCSSYGSYALEMNPLVTQGGMLSVTYSSLISGYSDTPVTSSCCQNSQLTSSSTVPNAQVIIHSYDQDIIDLNNVIV